MNTTYLSNLTYPVAARLRAEQVLKMQTLARELDISMSKLVALILDDVLPAFDSKRERAEGNLEIAYRFEQIADQRERGEWTPSE
jgi:hypothetical protein